MADMVEIKATVLLNGLEEKLQTLGTKLAKSAMRKALKAGGQILLDEAKLRAPVDTGALRDSIDMKVSTNTKAESGTVTIGAKLDQVVRKAGGDQSQTPGVYGMFVEFGVPSRNIAAKPWLRPSFDSKGEAAVEAFVNALRDGLVEVAK